MTHIPILSFVGYSGTGKTTLLEKVVANLVERGVSVAVLKHDVHGVDLDREGKDSWRFTEAGAAASIVHSSEKTGIIEQRPLSLAEAIERVRDVDLLLAEGYKGENLPQIGLARQATGKGFPGPLDRYIALITDCDVPGYQGEVFGFDDIDAIVQFVLEHTYEATPADGGRGLACMERSIGQHAAGDVSACAASKEADGSEKCGEGNQATRSMLAGPTEDTRSDFTHFDETGRSRMVDVGGKPETSRTAVAAGRVRLDRRTFELVKSGGFQKGDVLGVAQIAGIMGAKRTSDLIPMCHPIAIDGIDVSLTLNETTHAVDIEATVHCSGRTGVEMEALTAVTTAALTVYDMCKAVQRDIVISDIRLLKKTGGMHGDYERKEERQ